ncbi:hypothetical protein CLF_106009 [Clonorchis sinensis]|uniref:Uncharacterized protein n=1 Tax=Clonorchis sinensis TaxID=79923 RepID=G7YEJ3_CLOSI|nr:hypothetical protein CLF_106009 [Clonorchis sinensis]
MKFIHAIFIDIVINNPHDIIRRLYEHRKRYHRFRASSQQNIVHTGRDSELYYQGAGRYHQEVRPLLTDSRCVRDARDQQNYRSGQQNEPQFHPLEDTAINTNARARATVLDSKMEIRSVHQDCRDDSHCDKSQHNKLILVYFEGRTTKIGLYFHPAEEYLKGFFKERTSQLRVSPRFRLTYRLALVDKSEYFAGTADSRNRSSAASVPPYTGLILTVAHDLVNVSPLTAWGRKRQQTKTHIGTAWTMVDSIASISIPDFVTLSVATVFVLISVASNGWGCGSLFIGCQFGEFKVAAIVTGIFLIIAVICLALVLLFNILILCNVLRATTQRCSFARHLLLLATGLFLLIACFTSTAAIGRAWSYFLMVFTFQLTGVPVGKPDRICIAQVDEGVIWGTEAPSTQCSRGVSNGSCKNRVLVVQWLQLPQFRSPMIWRAIPVWSHRQSESRDCLRKARQQCGAKFPLNCRLVFVEFRAIRVQVAHTIDGK